MRENMSDKMSESERTLNFSHVCSVAHFSHCWALVALFMCFQQCSRAISSVQVLKAVVWCFQQGSGFSGHIMRQSHEAKLVRPPSSVKHFELSFRTPSRSFFRAHVGCRSQTSVWTTFHYFPVTCHFVSITLRCFPLPFHRKLMQN